MTKSSNIAAAFLLAVVGTTSGSTAHAQNAVLAEMYGRGVHAFYSGDQIGAYDLFSMAIDNGTTDPRAYYFRGLVGNAMGRQDEAEADWNKGAELEALAGPNPAIGRSLARFQGSSRLKLEQIRQTARLRAMASATDRAKARYGEIQAAESIVLRGTPKPPAAAPVTPPVPPAAPDDNPFADDMATGQPKVESTDVLEGAMKNPFGDTAAAAPAAAADAGANPFGGAPAGADPFGGAPAAGADPFGGAPAADADPFGGGAAGGDAMADPFGGDPFGN